MRKTLKWVAVAAIVSAVALVNVKVALDADSTNEWLASLLTFTENGEDMIRHQRNDPRECTVKEAYECKLGFTIPDWVPYLGGTDCYIEYVDEVEFPGTQNFCVESSSKYDFCDYFPCQKNGVQ